VDSLETEIEVNKRKTETLIRRLNDRNAIESTSVAENVLTHRVLWKQRSSLYPLVLLHPMTSLKVQLTPSSFTVVNLKETESKTVATCDQPEFRANTHSHTHTHTHCYVSIQ